MAEKTLDKFFRTKTALTKNHIKIDCKLIGNIGDKKIMAEVGYNDISVGFPEGLIFFTDIFSPFLLFFGCFGKFWAFWGIGGEMRGTHLKAI